MLNFVGLLSGLAMGVMLLGGTGGPADGVIVTSDGSDLTPSEPLSCAEPVAASSVVLTSAPAGIVAGLKMQTTPVLRESSCPDGTLEVEGDYCPVLEQKCLRWVDNDKMRCAEFASSSTCVGKTVRKHFCIDRFEYPNRAGEKPVVMKTWYDAKSTCEKEGKRLCGESEWTLACEGEERLPYPYGYVRNTQACNIDKPHPDVNEKAIADPATRDAEVARLDQRDPSGVRESCVSPFGVHDMTGNVDEWVINETGVPFKSGLKGGYWGPVRTRCRPMTTAHAEDFAFYQIGFRCCSDPSKSEGGAPSPPSESARLSQKSARRAHAVAGT